MDQLSNAPRLRTPGTAGATGGGLPPRRRARPRPGAGTSPRPPAAAATEPETPRCRPQRAPAPTGERVDPRLAPAPAIGLDLAERILATLEEISATLAATDERTPWLSLRKAERYARVRHGALAEPIATGELPSYRRTEGSMLVINSDDIDEWIRSTWTPGSR